MKPSPSWQATTPPQIKHKSRYAILAAPTFDETDISDAPQQQKQATIRKPLPIFVQAVSNYHQMIESIEHIVKDEQYATKCITKNDIKINVHSPDTYRKLVKTLSR